MNGPNMVPVRVVKYGGGVLRTPADLPRCGAHAALRASDGHAVVAVVSAFRGRTDALLRRASEAEGRGSESASARERDLLLSIGEIETAALLGLALRGRGVEARALAVHELGLTTHDGAATADGLAAWAKLLRPGGVVVAPGFLAVDAATGAVATLGRGGGDLTAVLLATLLGAELVELIKDVSGVYERDPDLDPAARRFDAASYEEVLAFVRGGARIVQAAALEEARRSGVPIRVASLDDARGTLVGTASSGLFSEAS